MRPHALFQRAASGADWPFAVLSVDGGGATPAVRAARGTATDASRTARTGTCADGSAHVPGCPRTVDAQVVGLRRYGATKAQSRGTTPLIVGAGDQDPAPCVIEGSISLSRRVRWSQLIDRVRTPTAEPLPAHLA